jgi:hypothetical protein
VGKDVRNQQADAEEAWHAAQRYAYHLAHGGRPATIVPHGAILHAGEQAAFETAAEHARFYGDDGTYTHTNGMFLGSWQFVAAGFAATAMANSMKKHRAEAHSVPRWRDVVRTRVVATSQRLLVEVPGRGLLSFWYAGMQELYPAPRQWALVMAWADSAPLRLSGLSAPYLAVHVAAHVMPDQWTRHPALAELVDGPVDRP